MNSMITAVNTIGQLQKQFDIVSNNMANSQTNGFKRKDVSFADMMVANVNNQPSREKEVGRTSDFGIRQGVGALMSASSINLEQGPIKTTDRSLDIAFTVPNQFLKVEAGGEIQYTRNGALHLSPTGNNQLTLVTESGHPVLDENNNMIVFPDGYNEFLIDNHGVFTARGETGQMSANLGVIAIKKPQYMEQKGDSLLGLPANVDPASAEESIFTELNGGARTLIGVQQRALEGSNVDLSKEMTDMLNIQRALQFQSRSFTLSDQMAGLVNGIR